MAEGEQVAAWAQGWAPAFVSIPSAFFAAWEGQGGNGERCQTRATAVSLPAFQNPPDSSSLFSSPLYLSNSTISVWERLSLVIGTFCICGLCNKRYTPSEEDAHGFTSRKLLEGCGSPLSVALSQVIGV